MGNINQKLVKTGEFQTYLNRSGEGNKEVILFLHGSGPGVNAWANWRYALGACSVEFDCLAPDLIGFGDSGHPEERPNTRSGWMRYWVDQCVNLLDELGIDQAHVVGNSLGCSIAQELLFEHPERIKRVVLMGPGGTPNMKPSAELARARAFYEEPTPKFLQQIMSWFVNDGEALKEEIASITDMRYQIAMKPDTRESNESIFSTKPTPVPPTALERIKHDVLLVHGRDDRVCSVDSSYYLLEHIPNAQLHVFPNCGHWAQIEKKDSFHSLILSFFKNII
ncbi:alpha/beta hydrolase [Neobacillus sp. FSL H8-0543]|uniref:alpha/beta fold hydrolase n=1 Tax=Neobacillus sp. FSL H8-0543 TaxID=2954672 RepID=UPI00315874AE